ncbi:MAG: hypothetical protein ACE5GM_09970 [bacterium]
MGAINYLNQTFKDTKKKVNIIYWSGDCQPPEEALKIVEENHLLNLNGGDTRKDRKFPSYTSVAPLCAQLGKYRQIYSSGSNENTYTNLWTGPFFGFRKVTATWKETDSPYRLQPVNLYYHFYSGERFPSLNALISNIEYIRSLPLHPVFPSRFVKIVKGFFSASIEELAGGGYRFSRLGECRTVRFDHTDTVPDFTRSRGVMGYTFHNNSIYIALDPDVSRPVLYLKKETPKTAYLMNAGCRVGNWKATSSKVSLLADGFGKQALTIHVPEDGRYSVSGVEAESFEVSSHNHELTFELTLNQKRRKVIINKLN